MKKTILLIFILGICILAAADYQVLRFLNGNKLYTRLLEDFGSDWSYGVGYVIGVHDAHNEVSFSSPNEITQNQVIAVVKKYLENHPEKLHYAAPDLICLALQEAFPKKETPAFPERGYNGNGHSEKHERETVPVD